MSTILDLWSIGDAEEVTVVRAYGEGGHPELHLEGLMPILQLLDPQKYPRRVLVLGSPSAGSPTPGFTPALICNSICDPDSNREGLEAAERVIGAYPGVRVVNPPGAVRNSSRERLASLAVGIAGLRVPKTVRIAPLSSAELPEWVEKYGMEFPVLFRPVGGQEGRALIRIDSAEESGKLEAYALDGREFYLSEFVDFRSSDGYYRKYRFFIIAGKILPGHVIYSKHWKIQRDTIAELPPALKREAVDFLSFSEEEGVASLGVLAEKIGLDFMGVDCSFLADGKILLFEANACMNPFSEEKEPGYYTEAWRKRIVTALESLMDAKISTVKSVKR
ncbi:ATP-grasp domain-containing protein [Nitratifractor salsuginis]|uniref:ATP-grasp domain-containing protein n=1 Tax=Nitratifractor salsuginis (strain DSM 16511 / JCM 12458 / E9I37-1) TaxID=749222 RepID=E6WZ75_NITSE|nr:hypothetical protein [Nitratifractor salsuginis]ADV46587.1 hypothetical protein Nitsa_1336 [Nitratifractor salsuginis DSM 16511]